MASLRPSAFNREERADGGPFLIVQSPESEEEGVTVFFTDVPEAKRSPDPPRARLLNISPDKLSIWPLNVREDRDDYLSPKYDALERIVIARRIVEPYLLPTTTEEVVELLQNLPEGFAKDFRFGLGLLWEYRQICQMIATLEGIDGFFLNGGDELTIDPPLFAIGEKRFHELRKELNRISARYQRHALKEKQFRSYTAAHN